MLKAMKAGKHVVTPNKAAVAANYKELTETAKANNVSFRFEASVGGGIPALTAIQEALSGNEFLEVMGIVNGTTNYILSCMQLMEWNIRMLLRMHRLRDLLKLILLLTLKALMPQTSFPF